MGRAKPVLPVPRIHAVKISCLRPHKRSCRVVNIIPSHGDKAVTSPNRYGTRSAANTFHVHVFFFLYFLGRLGEWWIGREIQGLVDEVHVKL
ncbi:hypothetical protein F0562_020393 [Nyssa sinensis]|uniref:Uncharacterized protein n=1 Tax=Nyssa sinensis TaxID=561372 RepID=A0A5J5BRN7_9ASTE|nr:hypothetical protein F0562_020393 [Nyssa sinensis]